MNGVSIPPLIGLCVSQTYHVNRWTTDISTPTKPHDKCIVWRLHWRPSYSANLWQKDKPLLGDLYQNLIRENVAKKRRMTIWRWDGVINWWLWWRGSVNTSIKRVTSDFKQLQQSCIEFFKGAANSTSVLQVTDLIKMFHNVKTADRYVNKLTQ